LRYSLLPLDRESGIGHYPPSRLTIAGSSMELMSTASESDVLPDLGEDIFCPACGYNLYGGPGMNCPECGYSLVGLRSQATQVPWVHRGMRGRFRAYWQTVWMVTFRNRLFCEEYARPVSYRGAKTFQWVTVLHFYLPVLVVTLLIYATVPPDLEVPDFMQQMMAGGPFRLRAPLLERLYAATWPAVVLHVCMILLLLAATAAPSYFYHPREVSVGRQNSAVAMSYYTCGPLALLIPVFVIALLFQQVLGVVFSERAAARAVASGIGAAGFAGIVVVLLWWLNLVRTSRRIMPQLRGRAWAAALGIPCLWLALGLLILLALPLCVFAVLVVIDSLG